MEKAQLLIIDDEPGILETLSDIFTAKGYAVQKATSGKAAMKCVASRHIDLALIDIQLPDMSGIEVLHQLKRQQPSIQCCVMTGNASVQDAITALKGGAGDFFVKPLVIEQVERRLATALENMQLMKDLASSQEQYRLVTEKANDAIIIMNDTGKVTYWNPAAERIFGYDFAEIYGRDLHETLMPSHLAEHYQKGFSHFSKTGEGAAIGKTLELSAIHKDGHEFPIELSLSIMRRNSHWQAVAIVRDITERIKAQEELARQHQELKETQSMVVQQEKLASIGHIAAGVAHEINNPLGYITSNLRSLGKYAIKLEEYVTGLQGRLQEAGMEEHDRSQRKKINFIMTDLKALVEESLQGAKKVKTIVDSLKNFARHDEEMHFTDLNECVENALTVVWNELKYRGTVTREYGKIGPVSCVAGQIGQVLMNLLVNAADVINEDGVVGIRTWSEEDMACVAISDNGPGIPDDLQTKIFEPFFTTKEVGKGTGLGLSISLEIVKRHNGTLTVDSKEGRGTTFTLRLPLC